MSKLKSYLLRDDPHWWEFWNLMSGMPGGILAGLIFSACLYAVISLS
jgi:hypothetical protein